MQVGNKVLRLPALLVIGLVSGLALCAGSAFFFKDTIVAFSKARYIERKAAVSEEARAVRDTALAAARELYDQEERKATQAYDAEVQANATNLEPVLRVLTEQQAAISPELDRLKANAVAAKSARDQAVVDYQEKIKREPIDGCSGQTPDMWQPCIGKFDIDIMGKEAALRTVEERLTELRTWSVHVKKELKDREITASKAHTARLEAEKAYEQKPPPGSLDRETTQNAPESRAKVWTEEEIAKGVVDRLNRLAEDLSIRERAVTASITLCREQLEQAKTRRTKIKVRLDQVATIARLQGEATQAEAAVVSYEKGLPRLVAKVQATIEVEKAETLGKNKLAEQVRDEKIAAAKEALRQTEAKLEEAVRTAETAEQTARQEQ